MTLYEFTALSSPQQLAAVWQQGNFLASRQQGDQPVNLYTMGAFFVEVFYLPSSNEITRHRAFLTSQLLLTYVPDQLLSQLIAR
jgi:hypothetical protein